MALIHAGKTTNVSFPPQMRHSRLTGHDDMADIDACMLGVGVGSRPHLASDQQGLMRKLTIPLTVGFSLCMSPTAFAARPADTAAPLSSTARETPSASERISIAANISQQLKPFWTAPDGEESERLVTILAWSLNQDGTLKGRPLVVRVEGITPRNRNLVVSHVERAIKAVERAAPFRLPSEFYPVWQRISGFRFDRRALDTQPRSSEAPVVTSWITTAGYPREALRNGWQGVAGFTVTVDSDGSVKDCKITQSSGYAVLDEATCHEITLRARFNPGRDKAGKPIVSTYSQRVRWQIPTE